MRSGKWEVGRGVLVRRREVGKIGLMGPRWRMVQGSQVVPGGGNGAGLSWGWGGRGRLISGAVSRAERVGWLVGGERGLIVVERMLLPWGQMGG